MIKVLVADDHPVVRDGLRALFAEYPSIDLVGEAATGREAIKAAVINKPDVIIMDLAMPDTDGFSATAEISRVAPEVAKTVNNNTSSIFNKLNVGTRTEAAILARDRGLGSTSK
jgi:DNA-binding NarL/FixJ family response regulator